MAKQLNLPYLNVNPPLKGSTSFGFLKPDLSNRIGYSTTCKEFIIDSLSALESKTDGYNGLTPMDKVSRDHLVMNCVVNTPEAFKNMKAMINYWDRLFGFKPTNFIPTQLPFVKVVKFDERWAQKPASLSFFLLIVRSSQWAMSSKAPWKFWSEVLKGLHPVPWKETWTKNIARVSDLKKKKNFEGYTKSQWYRNPYHFGFSESPYKFTE